MSSRCSFLNDSSSEAAMGAFGLLNTSSTFNRIFLCRLSYETLSFQVYQSLHKNVLLRAQQLLPLKQANQLYGYFSPSFARLISMCEEYLVFSSILLNYRECSRMFTYRQMESVRYPFLGDSLVLVGSCIFFCRFSEILQIFKNKLFLDYQFSQVNNFIRSLKYKSNVFQVHSFNVNFSSFSMSKRNRSKMFSTLWTVQSLYQQIQMLFSSLTISTYLFGWRLRLIFLLLLGREDPFFSFSLCFVEFEVGLILKGSALSFLLIRMGLIASRLLLSWWFSLSSGRQVGRVRTSLDLFLLTNVVVLPFIISKKVNMRFLTTLIIEERETICLSD